VLDLGSIISGIGSLVNEMATGKLEREAGNAAASALASMAITHLWSQGNEMNGWWKSEGDVLKDDAMALYVTLSKLEEKNFLTLTVPGDLLADTNRRAKFQTEAKTK